MTLLDANVCIEIIRGRDEQVAKLYEQSDPSLLFLPSVVAAELLFGALKSVRKDAVSKTESFIGGHELISFGENEARIYSRLRFDLEIQGQRIGANDMMIAATALAWNATLVTHNIREFNRISGLRVVDWQN